MTIERFVEIEGGTAVDISEDLDEFVLGSGFRFDAWAWDHARRLSPVLPDGEAVLFLPGGQILGISQGGTVRMRFD